jgi:hypothetical protein
MFSIVLFKIFASLLQNNTAAAYETSLTTVVLLDKIFISYSRSAHFEPRAVPLLCALQGCVSN